MERQALTRFQLNAIVRLSAQEIPECARCLVGDIVVRRFDDEGCNWSIPRIEGRGCLECLTALTLLIADLRGRYSVEVRDVLNEA